MSGMNLLRYHFDYLDASDKAEQLFGPVLTNRSKAEKIRSTLSVLEKYKYFFNLRSTIMDSIKQVFNKNKLSYKFIISQY